MRKLQEIFDGFPLAERELILRDAGLEYAAFSGNIDVRKDPQSIIAAILRRMRFPNTQLSKMLHTMTYCRRYSE